MPFWRRWAGQGSNPPLGRDWWRTLDQRAQLPGPHLVNHHERTVESGLQGMVGAQAAEHRLFSSTSRIACWVNAAFADRVTAHSCARGRASTAKADKPSNQIGLGHARSERTSSSGGVGGCHHIDDIRRMSKHDQSGGWSGVYSRVTSWSTSGFSECGRGSSIDYDSRSPHCPAPLVGWLHQLSREPGSALVRGST